MPTRICQQCGSPYEPYRARAPQKYCSHACSNRARKGDLVARFWSKVRKTEGCWYWTASVDARGYGQFRVDGKCEGAHRVAYDLTHDTPLGSSFGCHTCDNPSCVRPDHIYPGTQFDNMKDRSERGRFVSCPVRPWKRKMTEEDIAQIRIEYAAGGVSQRSLSKKYGVSQKLIFDIVHGRAWTDAAASAAERRLFGDKSARLTIAALLKGGRA
jgi:hypothetical protein